MFLESEKLTILVNRISQKSDIATGKVAMKNFFKKRIEKILLAERSPHKLALSSAVGTFIAFSPFLGIQTPLLFIVSWIMRLNAAVVFAVVYIVNNPWTMIPIVVLDYMVGVWVSTHILRVDLGRYNPAWMNRFTAWLSAKLGSYLKDYIDVSQLSLWAYLIGGMIVATIAGVITYPLARYFFGRLIKQRSLLVRNKE
jgi:uncharacterized protein